MDSSSGGAAATVTSMAPSCTVTSRSAKTSVSSSSGAASDWSNSTAGCGGGGKPHKGGDPRWKAVLTTRARDGPLGMGDFRLLRRLGCGDIGTVYLSELSNGAGAGARAAPWFAMKVMDKASLESRRKLSRAQTELEILQLLDHPFLGYRIARVSSSSAAAGGFFQQDELLPPECLDRLAVAVYRRAGKVPVDCVFCLSRIDEGEEVRELGHGAR